MTEKTRGYIYRVALAAGTVALVYGLVDENELLALGGLVAALCNVLPTKNTSTKD